ncbi:nucleotidyltransferase family protein [Azospirillum sp. SYSU D00513]|uniref:nucleotidyltransferase domain-containing protein n=1 Tax=Azospirillum sp. SYSU D00513 TaxID=2812561 RepID=UPI001A977FF1|nr:nucleotidyltransferase family protein [Azospirillum sp. SYSU D00513]
MPVALTLAEARPEPSPGFLMTARWTGSPEISLLCGIIAMGQGAPPPLPERGIDWDRFLRMARHHRVAPLLGPALDPAVAMPERIRAALALLRQRTAMQILARNAEMLRLVGALEGEGIEVLVLKGAPFAIQIHGDPNGRASRDIDLMVRPEAEEAALALLNRLGYRSTAADDPERAGLAPVNEVELVHPVSGHCVELHTRFIADDRLFPMAVVRPFETAVTMTVAGRAVRIPAPETALCFAALHGTKHLWRRLFWAADMAAAARRESIDWTAVLDLALRTNTERHLALGLHLAQELFGTPVPSPVLALPSAMRAARRALALLPPVIDGDGLANDVDAIARVGGLRYLWWEFRLYRRLSAGLAVLGMHARPTLKDRAAVALPPWLDGLYYLVRVFRIVGGSLFGGRGNRGE